jgi:fatty-acid desaturase
MKLQPHIWKIIIPQHLLFLFGLGTIIFGGTSWLWLFVVFLGYAVLGYLGFTIFSHRYWCHNTFKTWLPLARFGCYLGTLCGNGTPIAIQAIHMSIHHPNSDTEKDPHTPIFKGKLWSWFLWHNQNYKWPRLSNRMLNDPFIKFLHRQYFKVFWVTFAVLALISWKFAIFFMIGGGLYHFHLEGFVNSLCHNNPNWGYTNGDSKDTSINHKSKIMMYLSLGNTLHHNHHLQPWNYTYAIRPGEFDLAKYIVPLIRTDGK